MNSIGDIIYFLYDNTVNVMLPMLKNFVELLTTPIEDLFSSLGWLGDVIGWITSLFFDDMTLLQFMIGSGVTIYICITLAKYLLGVVDSVLPDIG